MTGAMRLLTGLQNTLPLFLTVRVWPPLVMRKLKGLCGRLLPPTPHAPQSAATMQALAQCFHLVSEKDQVFLVLLLMTGWRPSDLCRASQHGDMLIGLEYKTSAKREQAPLRFHMFPELRQWLSSKLQPVFPLLSAREHVARWNWAIRSKGLLCPPFRGYGFLSFLSDREAIVLRVLGDRGRS